MNKMFCFWKLKETLNFHSRGGLYPVVGSVCQRKLPDQRGYRGGWYAGPLDRVIPLDRRDLIPGVWSLWEPYQ